MQENLIYILEESIKFLDENIKEMSSDLRYLKRTYDLLIPNKKKRQSIKVCNMDEEGFARFMQVLEYNNRVLYDKIIKLDKEGEKLDQEHDKYLNNPIYNLDDLTRARWSMDYAIKQEELYEKSSIIYAHACTYYVELYEAIEKEKEETKSTKKLYEYALKSMKTKKALMTRDISTITNLISELEIDDQDREELFDELNDYIKRTKKEKVITVAPKEEIKQKKVIYKDLDSKEKIEEIEEEQEDIFSYNYLVTLKSFESFNDINAFLNSIKMSCNISRLIESVISLLDDTKEDNLLKEYLTLYLSKNEKVEIETEDNENENTVLYHGFYDIKSKIISDIEKTDIPMEYYPHIKEALDMIKQGTDKNKFKRINSVGKVLKLRYKDIRITYRRIAKNTYIILGIFCKKDAKGNNIVATTKRRDEEFSKHEKSIVEAINISELWDEYIKVNSNIDDIINKKLLNSVKI